MLPRLLSTVLLLICIAMLAPIGAAAIALARGSAVPVTNWAVPLVILATGSLLTWLLTRRSVSVQLYLFAFSLWVITAGFCFFRFV